jgi:hypothetical protein
METGTNEPKWTRGLPPGKYYNGMVDDFEAVPTVMGWVHRRRTPEEIAARKREAEART